MGICLSPDAKYWVINEDTTFKCGEVECLKEGSQDEREYLVEKHKVEIHQDMPTQSKFIKMGDKIYFVTSSVDKSLEIRTADTLEKVHVFTEAEGRKLHDNWVWGIMWNEKLGMLLTHGFDNTLSRVMFD